MVVEFIGSVIAQKLVEAAAIAAVGKLKQRALGDPEMQAWQEVVERTVVATRRRIDTAEAEYLRIELFAPATGRGLAWLLTLNVSLEKSSRKLNALRITTIGGA